MTDQPTCGTCRFWKDDAHGGQCRRRAPTVVVKQWDELAYEEDSETFASVCEVVSHCPKVSASFWCGEHEPSGFQLSGSATRLPWR